MSCIETASCEEGDHTYSWPCDLAMAERVCDHGHAEMQPWSGATLPECWYGHPITSGVATCECPDRGR